MYYRFQGKTDFNYSLVIKYKSLLYKNPETYFFLIQKCGINFRNNGSKSMWVGMQPQPSLWVSLQRGAWFLFPLPTSNGPMAGLLTECRPGLCPGGRCDWLCGRRQKTSVWLHLYSGKISPKTTWASFQWTCVRVQVVVVGLIVAFSTC